MKRGLHSNDRGRRALLTRAAIETLEERRLLANSAWVYPGVDGHLLYQPTNLGERISDFSNAGYKGGNVAIPNVAVKATVSPVAGDDTSTIQAAINTVSGMSLDANGFRGAVLLNPGTYEIGTQLNITASGVVLRGSGQGVTILHATGTGQRTIVNVNGSGTRSTVSGTTHNVIAKYVPSGAISFPVDSTTGLSVGSQVLVHRPSTANWIVDLGMDQLDFPWTAGSRDIDMERTITRIDGNVITIDAPITQALDQQYGGGTIYAFTATGRLNNVAVEYMSSYSDYNPAVTDPQDGPVDEDHPWTFINVDGSTNAWVRNVTSQYYGYSCVYVTGNSKNVTVQDSQCLDPISQITGGRRYSFNEDDSTSVLFRNNYAREGRHDFVLGSGVVGPNVFVDGLAENAHSDAGPHHRYSTAALFDNITDSNQLNIQNRGNLGSGHGWSGANEVVWNSQAGSFVVQNPPTAHNWLIGSTGSIQNGTVYVGPHDPGVYDQSGTSATDVNIRSLYYTQLQQRMAKPGAQYRELWLGDIDNYTRDAGTTDDPYVSPGWRTTINALAGGTAVNGFDVVQSNQFVPFSFKFSLAAGEKVIGASLSLGIKSSGATTSNDLVYLDSTASPVTFAQLGSTAPTAAAGGRVLDLGSQLALLQDGRLNVAIQNDSAIDWAVLNIQTAPLTANAPTRTPEADAYVRDGASATTNFGSDTVLTVKKSTSGFNREAYLRFDLTGLSASAPQYKVRIVPTNVGGAVENVMGLVTDDSWTEGGIIWNTKPASTVSFASFNPAANQPVEVDVTEWVKEVLAAGDTKLSLKLFALSATGDPLVDYASRDNATLANRPTLYAVTQSPTISSIANQGTAISAAKGPISFTIADAETATTSLLVSGSSSNTTLLPNANITFGGSGANRTVSLTPAAGQSGTADVTITVTDADGGVATEVFTLSVNGTFSAAITGSTRIVKNAGFVDIYVNGAVSATYHQDLATMSQLVLTGGAGAETLIVDTSNGLPLPAGGLSFDGGAGSDILTLSDTSAAESIYLAPNQVQIADSLIGYSNIETMNLTLGAGGDTLTTALGANTVTATTFNLSIAGGLLTLGPAALPNFTDLNIAADGELDMNGSTETIDALTGSGGVEIATANLIIGALDGTFTYNGAIGGNGSLIKRGSGVATLSGSNNYAGGTSVEKGTIKLGSASALPYGSVTLGNGTDAGNIDMNGFGASIASLTVTGNNATGNTITNLTAGKTLSILGSAGGNALLVGGQVLDNIVTKLTISGGGALVITNPAASILIDNDAINSSSTNTATLDVSGLASFTADVDQLNVGVSPTNAARARGVLTLATSNTLTANAITISKTSGNSATNTFVNLGQTNTIHANTITLASGKGNSGTIQFRSGLSSPTVTITDKNTGVGTDLFASYKSNTGTASPNGTINFVGGTVNATLNAFNLGWNSDASGNTATGIFSMSAGTVTANTLTVGWAEDASSIASGTLNISGGSFTVAGATTVAKLGAGATSTGVVNLTGGTASFGANMTDGGGASTLNLSGGSLNMTGHAIGDAGNPINTLTFASGTLSNVSQINGGAALVKTTAGTLNLTGVNTYTGPTNVTAGKLVLQGNLTMSSAISISAATMEVTALGTRVIKTPSISITSNGKLDLKDNKLIVAGGNVGVISGLIQSGLNGGGWDGSGIVTSMPAALSGLTTLAVATGDQTGYAGGTFGGVSVAGNDVLVMYTYAGDANLDGTINPDDYANIDFNAPIPGASGYYNGDFNYDGSINADDYALIDFNRNAQGAPFST